MKRKKMTNLAYPENVPCTGQAVDMPVEYAGPEIVCPAGCTILVNVVRFYFGDYVDVVQCFLSEYNGQYTGEYSIEIAGVPVNWTLQGTIEQATEPLFQACLGGAEFEILPVENRPARWTYRA